RFWKILTRESPLDVSNVGSIGIELTNFAGMGDPTVTTKLLGKNSPVQVSPAHKAKILEDTVKFQWKGLIGTDTYVVQVILKKRLGRRRSPDERMWTFTVGGGKTELQWDVKNIPSGEFLWSVLAFDDEKVVGVFSPDRSFTIVR
ncbi:MAG: hypothetical protein NT023_24650, partial [Armatimonadetes bacterium]|nr:hypothetical protein [Armatimonadota bacterium]